MRTSQTPLPTVIFALCLACPVVLAATQKDSKQQPQDPEQASADALELRGCGPRDKEIKFSADTDKKKHPIPDQPADSALVYVLRPTMVGNKVQTTLAVDGEWKGVNRGNNYFFFTLSPGEHVICSKAENRSVMALTVQAGKTYYLQQHISMGFMKARTRLEPMPEAEATKKLPDLHPSTWQIKK